MGEVVLNGFNPTRSLLKRDSQKSLYFTQETEKNSGGGIYLGKVSIEKAFIFLNLQRRGKELTRQEWYT